MVHPTTPPQIRFEVLLSGTLEYTLSQNRVLPLRKTKSRLLEGWLVIVPSFLLPRLRDFATDSVPRCKNVFRPFDWHIVVANHFTAASYRPIKTALNIFRSQRNRGVTRAGEQHPLKKKAPTVSPLPYPQSRHLQHQHMFNTHVQHTCSKPMLKTCMFETCSNKLFSCKFNHTLRSNSKGYRTLAVVPHAR